MKTRDTLPAEIDGFRLIETPDLCPECWGEVFLYEGKPVCIDCLEWLPIDNDANTDGQ